jgi:hypothetical protein
LAVAFVAQLDLELYRSGGDRLAVEGGAIEQRYRVKSEPFTEADQLLQGHLVGEGTCALGPSQGQSGRDQDRSRCGPVERFDEVAHPAFAGPYHEAHSLQLLEVVVGVLPTLTDCPCDCRSRRRSAQCSQHAKPDRVTHDLKHVGVLQESYRCLHDSAYFLVSRVTDSLEIFADREFRGWTARSRM